jgi:UrcA family protein
MTSTVSRIAGLATLALAALPIAALTTTAYAAPAAVKASDLNLNTAAGMATFQQRAHWVAKEFCRDAARAGSKIDASAECRAAVKAEIQDKLAAAQSAQLGRAATYAAR